MRDLKLILERDNAVYYSYEPLQRILPKLSDEDKEDLKIDISKKGLKETIKVVKLKPAKGMDKDKAHYVVLDGVHRLEAIKELGIEPKIQIGEVKKEDWLRIGIQLNVNAKRGRQIKKKDLVKKLYRRYKRRAERAGKRPSVEEFKRNLETYGLYLTIETVKRYLFGQQKHTNTNESLKSQVTRGSAENQENARISTNLPSNSAITNVAALLNTDTNSLAKTLRELAPKLDSLSKQLGRSHLEVLRFCVEAVATSLAG